ncbi:hypothetical protein LEP1GSC060_3485 [Leptospira weilii serovar Ranarum str. ICFT]|uniref:Uncharacterized protein n=1 Tax=Leptospira weilii serovar Ranarum str. ICFT TaxID=1218598 RepID=N1WM32_9LEPT|nr:hypothetical protein [Leptospira weilii]EMY76853.1 hypothetical protein LEP1GSC060_3485 [Leptospira weilii serovar Ranarum str. ICFT]
MTRAIDTLSKPTVIFETRDGIQYVGCTYNSNPGLIERAREFVQLQYSKLGYVGYNPEFDRQFDLNGFSQYYIALNENEEIIATSRIVSRGPFGLPIEYSYRSDTKKRTIIEDGNVAEMNSFAATKMNVGSKVLSLSTDFLLNQDFTSTYGLFDIDRSAMGKLYNRIGAIESLLHPYLIYFLDYGKLIQGNVSPTLWKVQVSDKAKIIAKKCHS